MASLLIPNDTVICFLNILVSSSVTYFFISFTHFNHLNWFVDCIFLMVVHFSYMWCKSLFPVCDLSFYCLYGIFWSNKFLILMLSESALKKNILRCMLCLKNHFLPWCSKYICVFYCKRFHFFQIYLSHL